MLTDFKKQEKNPLNSTDEYLKPELNNFEQMRLIPSKSNTAIDKNCMRIPEKEQENLDDKIMEYFHNHGSLEKEGPKKNSFLSL